MEVQGRHYRTVWMEGQTVMLIDQNLLPFQFRILSCRNFRETAEAIRVMNVRGAGAIGVTAGYAMAQAFCEPDQAKESRIREACDFIEATRPTARNLFYATRRVLQAGLAGGTTAAMLEAATLADEDVETSRAIGEYGCNLLTEGCRVQTHCNAGWLAFTDWGSALSPVYCAKKKGINVFVYVDETRPRLQGARLTAWELVNEKIPHAVIPDNAGAWLMSQGKADLMIVGADRIAANGDVANKIGTLEKAIVAHKYGIPFYVAAPGSTFDLNCPTGKDIPIEERSEDEVLFMEGPDEAGEIRKIRVCAEGSAAWNPAFDVTPAEYISGIITEKGIIKANPEDIKMTFGQNHNG